MILDDVKTLLGISVTDTSKDSTLNIYIRIAKQKIKKYLESINIDAESEEIETNYPDATILLVIALHKNRDRNNYAQSETQSSRSTTYIANTDIPDNVKSLLPLPLIKLM